MRLALAILLMSGWVVSGADPLTTAYRPAGLSTAWQTLVGHSGAGIPYRTTVHSNLALGISAATAQTAQNNCPSNRVITIEEGTYNWSDRLNIDNDGVTFRGLGTGAVIYVTGDHGVLLGSCCGHSGGFTDGSPSNHRNWTGGYTQGATSITVDSTTGLFVGQMIYLDQLNTLDITAYSPDNPAGPWVSGEYSSVAFPNGGRDRIQFQVNVIAGISGTTITLQEPLYAANWNQDGTNDPELWFISTQPLVRSSGVENIRFITSTPNAGVLMENTIDCWATNCWVSISNTTHLGSFYLNLSLRPSVLGCTLYDTINASGGDPGIDRYGIHTRVVSGALVENNFAYGHMTMLMVNGVSGSVFAYNYGTNLQVNTGSLVSGIVTHGGSPNYCLFEGNRSYNIGLDTQWQNSFYMCALRNRLRGRDDSLNATGNRYCYGAMTTNRYSSCIGGVLGITGTQTTYMDDNGSGLEATRVFWFGGNGDGSLYDSQSRSTAILAANWTSATSTNNGINLEGFTTNDIPNSYYLASKPGWFGGLNWPVVDPTNPSAADHGTNWPSAYRFYNLTNPPSFGGGGGSGASGQTGTGRPVRAAARAAGALAR